MLNKSELIAPAFVKFHHNLQQWHFVSYLRNLKYYNAISVSLEPKVKT